MPPSPLPQPTEVELEILRVLWRLGPSTVRQVHLALSREKETGYSTTLKMMQVMRDKGLLLRDDSVRPQVYRPAVTQERTQLQLVDDLVRRAFGGSAARLMMRALASRRVSAEELSEIEELIKKAKR
jgi:predicted transcriptional regulator